MLNNRFIFWLSMVMSLVSFIYPFKQDLSFAPAYSDKFIHTLLFLALAFLMARAYPNIKTLFILVALSLYGVAVELVQTGLPYRSFEISDIIADSLGVLLATLFLKLRPSPSIANR